MTANEAPGDHPHNPFTLTPADLQTLRASVTWRVSNGQLDDLGAYPHILFLPAEDTFLLRAYGRPMCASRDPALLAHCLRCERAEPGWLAKVMGTALPVDVAALDPAARLAEQRRRSAEATKARLLAEAQAAARYRRNTLIHTPPAAVNLDDLL